MGALLSAPTTEPQWDILSPIRVWRSCKNILLPVINEVICSVELGRIEDAYQARYIRDAIYSSEENKEKFSEIFSGAVDAGIKRAKELSMD